MFKEEANLVPRVLSGHWERGWQEAALGSLSSDVFERRTSTGNGRFALLSRDFEQIFGQIVSIRIKTLGNINTLASRLIKRGKGSLPVDVRRSKTSLLNSLLWDVFSSLLRGENDSKESHEIQANVDLVYNFGVEIET